MEHEPSIPPQDTTGSAPGPITVMDVLRAVFIPQSETEQEPLPEAVSSQLLSRARQVLSAGSATDISVGALDSEIIYAQDPIQTVANANPVRITILGFGVVASIALAYLAQTTLAASPDSSLATILYVLAAAVWVALLAIEIAPPDGGILRRGPYSAPAAAPNAAHALRQSTILTRSLLAVMSLCLSAATYVYTADNTFTLAGVLTWVGSIIGWMLVVAQREPEQMIEDAVAWFRQARLPARAEVLNRKTALIGLAVIAILGVAVFFRFYQINQIPGEMTSDHVEKLLDAYDVSQGTYHVFFPRNGGREAIQMYLVAIGSSLFQTGMSHLTLKLVTALEALALVPLVIFLGRELVDWETGLFAAALLAISWWDTSLARLGLRIVLTPLVFTCVMIAVLRGIRTRSRKHWVWAGFWLGVGMYAYQAMRMAPVVAVAGFLVAITGPVVQALRRTSSDGPDVALRRIVATNIIGRQASNLAACGIIALGLFVPMLRFWHDDPADLWNRVVNRTTSSEVQIQGTPTEVFVKNYQNALGMYNVKGDAAWIDSLPGAPTLDLISGALLILGLLAWLMRLRVRRDPADSFLLIAGLIMLLPSALALAFPIENPSVTRASGTLPIVMVLAAWPLALMRQRWSAVMGRPGTWLASGLAVILLAGAALFNYQTYFEKFNASYRLSALNPAQVAQAVRGVIGNNGSLDGVWLIGWPYWHDFRAIGIDAGDITFHNAILDSNELQVDLQTFPDRFETRPLVFIIAEQDDVSRAILASQFPGGTLKHYPGISIKHSFYLFVVSR